MDNDKPVFHSNVGFSPKKRKCRTTLRTLLGVALVTLFTTTVIFIGLFVYYYIRFQMSESTTGQTQHDNNIGTAEDRTDKVCITKECVAAAALMIKKMNQSADPCVDFHQYACGGFNRDAVLPAGYTQVNVFSMISDQNELVMREIVSGNITAEDPRYLQNMKRYYKSCMDIDQIERTGLPHYFRDPMSKDWPDMNPVSFRLSDVIARYAAVNTQSLFAVSIGSDYKNSSRKVLFLHDPSLGLSREYFSRPRNDSRIMAYEKFLKDIAEVVGVNSTMIDQDARDVVDLEIALSKIMPSTADRQDLNKVYNPVNVSQLATLYPSLDIPRAIRALFSAANVTIYDDDLVINMYPAFLDSLILVLSKFDDRVIQNLFSFSYAWEKIRDMNQHIRDIRLDFDKVIRGTTEEIPRWKQCLSWASTGFWKGMSKQFVARTFSEQAKAYMEAMIDNLKASFHQIIEESTWMGPPTKQAAYKKLAAMKFKVGYPDVNFTDQDIEKLYEKFTMLEDDHYSNGELANKLRNVQYLISFRKPVDRSAWQMSPHDVNAYYSVSDNEIAFLAGVLQPPAFSQTFQDYINYGAIGMVIGHEMTHGFDDQGSQFDGDGNLFNWWQQADRDVFLERSQCIQDQCSNFRLSEINMTLNGVNIGKESTADTGGLKQSFRAYKKLVSTKGEDPTLPGLQLTQDQLFFLAFGQLWCEKMTRESLISQVTSGTHPPGIFRIIGSLQNSEDFAKAYSCPRGSYMNPDKKCGVW